MREFFGSYKFKIILLILALLVGIMLYSVTQGGYTLPGISLLNKVFNPLKQLSNSISDRVEQSIEHVMNAQDYYKENQALKQQIAELNQDLADYQAAKRDLEELQQYVGIKDEHEDYTLSQPCTIISHITNDPYGSFVINRGSEDGISLNDPVITASGLCGVITELDQNCATVCTVLSSELSIGAISSNTLDTGIVEGTLRTAKNGLTKMIYLEEDHHLSEGDLILTSGTTGLFPQGCMIGTVVEIGMEESGLSAYALIQPAVDFESLTGVMVVLDFDGKGETNEDN